MTRCNRCDAEWTSRKWEHCRACCQTFSGTRSGDHHRIGDHAVYEGPSARRCLEPSEMLAAGMWSTVSSQGVLVWHGERSSAGVAHRRDNVGAEP